MEWIRLDPVVAWTLRLALALLFAAAALHKIRDSRQFRETLSNYELLPHALLVPASIGVIALEVLISIDLATGLLTGFLSGLFSVHAAGANALAPATATATWAGLAASGILGVYALAIAINLARGRSEIDCGCLGPVARQPLSTWLLARNGILALGAALTSLPLSGRSLHAIDGVTLLGGLIVLCLLFNTANLLMSDASRWAARESHS